MSSSDPPPAPNYVGAAQAQGQANIDAAIASGHINNPTVYNPYGSQTVSWNGNDPTISQSLSPTEQAIYNTNASNRAWVSNIGSRLLDSTANVTGGSLNFNGLQGKLAPDHVAGPGASNLSFNALNAPDDVTLGTGQKYLNDAYNAAMSRVNTDVQGQRDNKNSELIAAGIRPGTAAYTTAMGQIDRQYNDARQQALLGASQQAANSFAIDQGSRQQQMADFNAKQAANIQNFGANQGVRQQQMSDYLNSINGNSAQFGMDQAARKQAIAEQIAWRETPLNEATALINGTQINNPFANGLGYQAGANVQGAPIANAIGAQGQYAQNAYNANQAQMNGNISAGAGLIGSLGSAAMSRP